MELLTPLILVLLYLYYAISLSLVFSFIFSSVLITITFIDIEHQIIPDRISLPAIPLFFMASFFLPWIHPLDSLLGIMAGGGILYLVAKAYYLVRREDGMGGGDIKLLAMIGAFLGWKGAILSLMLGACAGTVLGIALMLIRGKNFKYALPFGPFLSLGAFCTLLWGDPIIHWYINLGK